MKCLVTRALLVCVLAALAGCAATGEERDPRDPFEGFNRGVYRFNDTFDEYLAQPVARTYRKAVHQEIRTRVGNFFANIQDIFIGVNNFLQGKVQDGVNDWARFAFNTTFGLLGIPVDGFQFAGSSQAPPLEPIQK